MAKICWGAVSESDTSITKPCEPSSRAVRRRRIEMRRSKFGCGGESGSNEQKRKKLGVPTVSRECDNAGDNDGELILWSGSEGSETKGIVISDHQATLVPPLVTALVGLDLLPKFGATSICGRRRDMEDAVAIHPFFCQREQESATELHYFGVYDGHGCSHVRNALKINT